jgi:hypothetical protein
LFICFVPSALIVSTGRPPDSDQIRDIIEYSVKEKVNDPDSRRIQVENHPNAAPVTSRIPLPGARPMNNLLKHCVWALDLHAWSTDILHP